MALTVSDTKFQHQKLHGMLREKQANCDDNRALEFEEVHSLLDEY